MSMRLIFAALALSMSCAEPALAQTGCAQREDLVEYLTLSFGETLNAGGLRDAASLYEVWVSDATGTWTILKTNPDGTACIVAAGTHWHTAAPGKEPTGTRS
jgi:hypothetical protein